MSGLRLDSRDAILKGGIRGPAFDSAKPESSLIVQAVSRAGDLKMPPAGPLSGAEVQVLTDWLKAGAPWPKPLIPSIAPPRTDWWSLMPVKRPAAPVDSKRKTKNENPIDAFVRAALAEKGLAPSPPAGRRTLIRRAYFDLIGLPPNPEEVEAFLNDKSSNAWEKVIDKLLASPHYGERWGRHWLDVARYADSLDSRGLGSEGDIAFAWRYRDWVVDALNRDMPYDQFIANQIAGDNLPADKPGEFNRAGVIATGFLAIGNWGNGDADKDKILTDIADDQVDVVSRAFMGLTVACARCHDHKFDPILQRDYYALAGIFFSTHILAKLTPKGEGEKPMRIPLLSQQDLDRRTQQAARLKALEAKLQTLTEQAYTRLADSMKERAGAYLLASWDYRNRPASESGIPLADYAAKREMKEYALRQWLEVLSPGGFLLMGTRVPDVLGSPGVHAWKGATDTPSLTVNTNDVARMLLTFTLPPRSVAVHPGPASGVAAVWRAPSAADLKITGRVADADSAGGDGIAWSIMSGERELARGDIPNGGQASIPAATVSVRPGDDIQLRILPKSSHTCDTTTVELTLEDTKSDKKWELTKELLADPLKGNPRGDSYGNSGVWRFVDMSAGSRGPEGKDGPNWKLWDDAVAGKVPRAELEKAAADFQKSFAVTDNRSPFRIRGIEDETALEPGIRDTLNKLRFDIYGLRRSLAAPMEYANGALEGGVPESPHAGTHDVPIHIRGRYDRLGDLVARGFPAVIAGPNPPAIASGSGRLELARWLASPGHPLTARVIANRIWQHHFGEGIVRTPNNFGKLGEKPTNQPLLDWLAAELVDPGVQAFRRSGIQDQDPQRPNNPTTQRPWSLKRLHKLIMMSESYKQSCFASEEARKKDPDNRLFGRQNRRRLDAESFRDALLCTSGELDEALGGPAIKDLNTRRRTLYVMAIRSDRSGYGPLFDMADSTNSVDKRTVSTVAPQALFLLNNGFMRDRAQALAQRMLSEKHADNAARIRRAYLLLYGRPAKDSEVRIGESLLATSASGVRPAANSGDDLERWAEYCQVLLSTNEMIYID